MASTADIKKGLCIEFNNDLYAVVDFQHVKPGKGPAFVRTKLKSLTVGKVVDHTFPSGHKINTARMERKDNQFLYKDDIGYHFMDTETYEQFSLEDSVVDGRFLKEGAMVEILFHAETEKPVSVDLPNYVELEVTYTEPGLKGDTATNATKPATLESGAKINVPLFINQGEIVKVDTKTGSYHERVKK